ncbi:hypothetical protein ACNKHX_14280 [Shigella flexneri]
MCGRADLENADDKRGRLVMLLHDPLRRWRLSIEDEEAKDPQDGGGGWQMTNHPRLPVCEEGGSCHLQDMTVMTGHNSRRYRFTSAPTRIRIWAPS